MLSFYLHRQACTGYIMRLCGVGLCVLMRVLAWHALRWWRRTSASCACTSLPPTRRSPGSGGRMLQTLPSTAPCRMAALLTGANCTLAALADLLCDLFTGINVMGMLLLISDHASSDEAPANCHVYVMHSCRPGHASAPSWTTLASVRMKSAPAWVTAQQTPLTPCLR